MQQEEINDLLKRYLADDCTEEERTTLESWYLKHEFEELPEISEKRKDAQLEQVWTALSESVTTHKRLWLWPAAAAMLLMTLGISFYLAQDTGKKVSRLAHQAAAPNLKSSNNKAMLTLADGRTIALDGAKNGMIAEQSGVIITKTKDGQLVYEGKTAVTALNNVATSKGGQYQINLPDGTKVWLNAASSLSYPAAFTGSTREVRLVGEAYFEVSSNKVMPFVVQTKGQEIKVLGTHFNVNAYENEEQIRTTLLEGSVRIRPSKSARYEILRPGQQATLHLDQLEVANTDVAEAIAWKEGYFLFQDENIYAIMKQISRWYDIEVVYAPDVSSKKIGGYISRSKPLDAVLKALTNTEKFNFKIQGRRVIVMP
jgi:transmembrane sensor